MKFKTQVIQTNYLSPSVKQILFHRPPGFEFLAGQFVTVRFRNKFGKMIKRQYSISSAPTDFKFIELAVTLVKGGPCSTYLHNLKIGDEVEMIGPAGEFVLSTIEGRYKKTFICTGTGVAPFRSMIWDVVPNNTNFIRLVAGYRCKEDALYHNEFESLSHQYENFLYKLCLSRENNPEYPYKKERVTDWLKDEKVLMTSETYICGLDRMVTDVEKILLDKNCQPKDIYYERYD